MKQSMARPLFIFYILVAYVLMQFTWWAYLLIDLNSEIVHQRENLAILIHQNPHLAASEKIIFEKELRKRIMMVIGEGTVFLGLLIFGIHQTRKAFAKEFSLAKQQKNFLLSITMNSSRLLRLSSSTCRPCKNESSTKANNRKSSVAP
jgi:two-component system phosphate regulon sensor histidine kinase PhoR